MKLKKTFLSRVPHAWSQTIVGITTLFLISGSLLYWNQSPIADLLTANRQQIFQQHQYWRLFTTLAVHADFHHFISNLPFFWIFGYFLFGFFGFALFPVLSIIGGALVNLITLHFYPDTTTLMGASGAVYLMASTWATLYLLIQRGTTLRRRLLTTLGASLVLFFPTTFEPHVSYLAHGIGFTLGIFLGTFYFIKNYSAFRNAEVWIQENEDLQSSTAFFGLHESLDSDPH